MIAFRDTIESLATAFVLAMVIKHFAVEAFKIPTRSMQPTLHGDPRWGDRILVNKFIYDIHDPKPWDVIVFKYPGDPSKYYYNYIKRLVALGGETVLIRDGNVIINGKVRKKPWRVQKTLFVDIMSRKVLERIALHSSSNPDVAEGKLLQFWKPDPPSSFSGGGDEILVKTSSQSFLRYSEDIVAYGFREPPHGSPVPQPPIPTGDIAIYFRFRPQKATGEVLARISDGTNYLTYRLPLDGSLPSIEHSGRRSSERIEGRGAFHFAPSRNYRVYFINVDDSACIRVNGRELLRYDYDGGIRDYETAYPRVSASLGFSSTSGSISHLTLYRDIFYTSRGRYGITPFRLKKDELFVLGDNSPNSNDSRIWGPLPRKKLLGEAFFVWFPRWEIIR